MLIKWGSIVVKGSGKLGGHVFSSGPGGASMHTLARTRNPQTKYQMAIRARFTLLSQGWRDLTESQRESWYGAESEFSRSNRFGDTVLLSGKNLYNALNAQRLIIGLQIVVVAPLPTTLDTALITQADIRESAGIFIIRGRFAQSKKYIVVATPSLSQGVNSFNDKFKIIGIVLSSFSGTDIGSFSDNYNKYVDVFGVPKGGSKIFVGLYSINSSGQKAIISSSKVNIQTF